MKKFVLLLLMGLIISTSFSQKRVTDSLNRELSLAGNDTLRLVLSNRLSWQWLNVNSDSSSLFAEQYLKISKKLDYRVNEADALGLIAYNGIYVGNYPRALETLFKALKTLDRSNQNEKILPARYLQMMQVPLHLQTFHNYSLWIEGNIHSEFAFIYWINMKDDNHFHELKASQIAEKIGAADLLAVSYLRKAFNPSANPDSSILYAFKAKELYSGTAVYWMVGVCDEVVAAAFYKKGDHESELKYLRSGLYENLKNYSIRNSGWSFTKLSDYFMETGIMDSVISYAQKALSVSVTGNYPDIELKALKQLADVYKSLNQIDSSYKYLQRWIDVKNKTLNSESARQFENVQYNQQLQEKELIAARERYSNRMKLFGLLAGLSVLLLVTIVLFWNNKRKKKINDFLQHKNLEIETQKNIAEKALYELKVTQAQLIQSEKMASLGELTAGIAHEIQNPLNFVNNFSEVSNELIDEMENELVKGNYTEARAIASDIRQNLGKINHHGKRADAIVKGMLQHSRVSNGAKEPTHINALADEYLRLAYHGLRAKDKSFNVSLKTDFDESVGKMDIVPQDIGRVILNLITNAFYAVTEKKQQNPPGYEPLVTVSTHRSGAKVEISVADNGNGIPMKVLDKIYQPFFTTKPSGQGTGLGLSMSYEIVTKSHGGELKVDTKEGEGAVFTIVLPV